MLLLVGCTGPQTLSKPEANQSTVSSTVSNCNDIKKTNLATIADIMNDTNIQYSWCNYLSSPYYAPKKNEIMSNCYSFFVSNFFGEEWKLGQYDSFSHWGNTAGENVNYYYVDVELTKETKNVDSAGNILEHYTSYVKTHQVLNPIIEDGRLTGVELVEFNCQSLYDKKQ